MKHRILYRLGALVLCLVLVSSLFGGVTVFADDEIWTEEPTGWINWGHVTYKTATVNNKTYVLNWGVRGELCRFRSAYALNFYPDLYDGQGVGWGYDIPGLYEGGTSEADATDSALYAYLHSFLAGKQTHKTSYAETRNLYRYTDCMVSNSDYISSFYSGIRLNGAWDGGATWNREHTWPKSKSTGDQENDIMMLRPTSVSENSGRGNLAYGESPGFYNPNAEAGSTGFDLRGDCARICLYCYVRWSENAGSMWGAEGVMESLDVLLDWMEQDPVDTWEMGRNDAVESITGVRNCFVDYPELAWYLFGRSVPESYPTPFKGDHNNFVSAPACLRARSNNEEWGTVQLKGWAVDCFPAAGYYTSGFEVWTIDGSESLPGGDWPIFHWETDDQRQIDRLIYKPVTESDYLVEIHFTPVGQDDPCPTGHAWDEGELLAPPTAAEDGAILYTCTRCGATWTKTLPSGERFWIWFDLNGYGYDGPAPQEVAPGETAADPGFTDYTDGMIFDGWYTEPECLHPYDFSAPVVDDLTLYASYVRGHVIHFEPNGAPEGEMPDLFIRHGETFVLPECGFLWAGQALDYWTVTGFSGKLDPGYPITIFQNYTVTAVWTTAKISFDKNGGTGYMEPELCPADGYYTLPACCFTPPAGKHFVGWDLGLPGDTILVYGNQLLTAQWEINEYSVQFTANGGGGTMEAMSPLYGERLLLPDCDFSAPEGQKFCKWLITDAEDNETFYYAGQFLTVSSDLTATAQWIPEETETCTITFNANGGFGTMPTLTVEKEAAFTLPSCEFYPPDETKGFLDWQIGARFLKPGRSIAITSNLTLKARWGASRTCIVTFDVQGHGTAPDPQEVVIGETVVRPEDPRAVGWRFICWCRTSNGFGVYDFSESVNDNFTLYAYWDGVPLPISLTTDGHGTAELSASSAIEGTGITVTAAPKAGYAVDKITYTPAGGETVDITSTRTFTMPAANVAVGVSFKLIAWMPYPITLETVGGGSAVLSKTAAEPWERVTVSASPEEGGALLRAVLVAPDGTEKDVTERMGFNMPEGPATVRVEFEQLPGNIWLSVGDGGTASCSAETAFPGEEITVTAAPDPGYRLKSITVTADYETFEDVTRTGKFTMPDSDVWVDVIFEELPPVPVYTVSLEVGEGGTAHVFPELAEAGEEITVTAEPDAAHGWELASILVYPADGALACSGAQPDGASACSGAQCAPGARSAQPDGVCTGSNATPWRTMCAATGTLEQTGMDITGTGTFTMPASDVKVVVTFARINPFVDVVEGKYYYDNVLWAYWHDPQITAGTDADHFSPNKPCTREQIMTFVWKAYGAPEPESTENPFQDVKDKYYKPAVLWAFYHEPQITGGMNATTFGVGQPCTRAQVVMFLWAAAGKPAPTATDCPFTDVKTTDYFYEAVLWAVETGVTGGTTPTTFSPKQTCTRAQVVTFLYAAVGSA